MINYTLKQLYSFETVIRLGSFTKASKELNITQPAVYMQIKQLQNNINVSLISVNGKLVFPTFIGKKFYKTSVHIIAKLEQTHIEIEQILNPEAGHLQVAVATTANSFVSRLLSGFRKLYPKMSFYLDVANRMELIDKLKNKQYDLIIMGQPPADNKLTFKSFMQNKLIAITNPSHPLLKNKYNSIDILKKETLITREKGSGTRATVERITKLNFNSNIEINSNIAIIEAVQAGLGIGFVSEHTVKLEMENNIIKQLNVEKFPIVRYWYIVHYKDVSLSLIARRFKKFVIESRHNNAIKRYEYV